MRRFTINENEHYRLHGRPAHQAVLVLNSRDERQGFFEPLAEPAPPRRRRTGAERRDAGMQRAASRSPFVSDACRLLPAVLRVGEQLMAEDLRLRLESQGLQAASVNQWGSLTMSLRRRGVLSGTGTWRASERPSAHARRNEVLRVKSLAPLASMSRSLEHQPPTAETTTWQPESQDGATS